MENQNVSNLKSLKISDYHIDKDEANILDWEIKNEAELHIGTVYDLLFDVETKSIRYLVVDLTHIGMSLENKKVIIPIGLAQLHHNLPEIILPNIHTDQFIALPVFDGNMPNIATENLVREIIGSPAALRMEETIAEIDQQQFYNHHHFDENKFYNRDASLTHQKSITLRDEQNKTIHQMVENAKLNDLNAADDETGTNSHHNEGKKIDIHQQNQSAQ